jgi:amino acid adenylation domain-containing protein
MRQPIHVAVRDIAVASPDALALVDDQERVTYSLLDSASDAYAELLAASGVRAGDVVPLVFPRTAQLIAIALGVLKCGASYTGIDHRWPLARAREVIRAAGSAPVVRGGLKQPWAEGNSREIPREALAAAADRATTFEPPLVSLDEAATVFFTSGTSGTPKGVVTTHRAVTRMFGSAGIPGFGRGHVTPQAAPVPWDMYAFEVWGQLTTGGTSVILGEDHLMPRVLRRLVRDERVDTVWLTTSLFNLFVDEDIDSLRGVRELYVGGEKQSADHVRRFIDKYPSIRIWNGYGPAENCMLSTLQPMDASDCEVPGGIPVGRAVPGTRVVVLDGAGQEAASNQVGEICVGGGGLALGYLNDEATTKQSFTEIDLDGERLRLYRTGDLGFRDGSGILHYRGRADRQVKLRGNRIELGELESAARRLPGVRNCAALAISGPDGYVHRLALYYTAGGSADLPPAEVRAQLAAVLPQYSVPAVVERVAELPITPNGKLDAAALLEDRAT